MNRWHQEGFLESMAPDFISIVHFAVFYKFIFGSIRTRVVSSYSILSLITMGSALLPTKLRKLFNCRSKDIKGERSSDR